MRITSRLLFIITTIGGFTMASNAAEPKEPLLVGLQFDGKFEKDPKLTFHPHTVYPPFLIEKKVSGDAKIMFHLTAQGFVDHVKVISSAHEALGASALATVSRMVFEAPKVDGKPIDSNAQITVKFVLD